MPESRLKYIKIVKAGLLVGILCLAFYMAFIPHINYQYPLHVDEWHHYGLAQALASAESTTYTEPFCGTTINNDHTEVGFHILLATMKSVTGLSWNNIFRFSPSFIFLFTVLAAYIMGRRQGFGIEAAFFTAMIPTTVRILGPAFLVPVSLGLAFFPTLIFILHNFKVTYSKAVLIFILLAALLLFHPPTGVALAFVSVIYAVFYGVAHRHLGATRARVALILGAVLASSLVLILRFPALIAEQWGTLGQDYYLPLFRDTNDKFGYATMVIFIIGLFFLCYRGKYRNYALIAYTVVFLLQIVLFSQFNIGIGIMYDRSFMYLFILASIIAGYGLKELRLSLGRYLNKCRGIVPIVMAILVTLLVFLSVRSHLREPYYYIVDDQTYEDFIWIRDSLDASYNRAVMDSWVAFPFPPITGRFIYTFSAIAPDAERIARLVEVEAFFAQGGSDTGWLRENGISIIYTQDPIDNPDLEKVRDRIYLLTD